jgi:hypothetical protein
MVPLPSAPKPSGAGNALAFVMVRATPLATIIMPSVAMNGGSFNRVIISPLRRPQTVPTSRPMIMLAQIGTPALAAITAIVPEKAMTDPMLRSIPPVMMVKVTPMPIRVIVLVCKARLRMLRMVKKFLAVIEKTVNSTITAPRLINLSRSRLACPFVSLLSTKDLFSIDFAVVVSLMIALPFGLVSGWTWARLLLR